MAAPAAPAPPSPAPAPAPAPPRRSMLIYLAEVLLIKSFNLKSELVLTYYSVLSSVGVGSSKLGQQCENKTFIFGLVNSGTELASTTSLNQIDSSFLDLLGL